MIDRSSRRRFGQNYLTDKSVIYQIVDKINPGKEDSFIEIGPGQGAITGSIKNSSQNLTLIEFDKENIAYLKSSLGDGIKIYEEDVLKIDLSFIKNNDRVIGNLPYNIASQIILRFLELNTKIFDMHFMVQKEMAEVLTSSPGNKSWNKFAVKVAFFYETEILLDISPEAFDIKPKVDSSLVRFKPINSQAFEIKKLFQIIDLSFQSKRKTIFNNLKKHNINWEKLKFDKNLRAEQLSLEDFLEIYSSKSLKDQDYLNKYVLKVHGAMKTGLLHSKILTTIRDPRDVCASFKEFMKSDFESALTAAKGMIKLVKIQNMLVIIPLVSHCIQV